MNAPRRAPRAGRPVLTRVSRVVAVLVLSLSAWVVQDQAAARSAHAVCLQAGWPAQEYWMTKSGAFYAVEDARESCNSNKQYVGWVADIMTDGSCVYAQYHDGSYTGVQGQSCDSAGFRYRFNDQTGDTSAVYRVYVDYYTPAYRSNVGY